VSSRAWLTPDERLDSGGRHGEATLVATRDDQQVSSHCLELGPEPSRVLGAPRLKHPSAVVDPLDIPEAAKRGAR
jgi:hypothetical protein